MSNNSYNKQKLVDEVSTKEDTSSKIKIRFNFGTMMITKQKEFSTPLDSSIRDNFIFRAAVNTYKFFRIGQIIEVTKQELADITAYFTNDNGQLRTAKLNNERMGNLDKIYKERLRTATPAERDFMKTTEHEFKACSFEKPIFEIVG